MRSLSLNKVTQICKNIYELLVADTFSVDSIEVQILAHSLLTKKF